VRELLSIQSYFSDSTGWTKWDADLAIQAALNVQVGWFAGIWLHYGLKATSLDSFTTLAGLAYIEVYI
jgi:hypothetical protein